MQSRNVALVVAVAFIGALASIGYLAVGLTALLLSAALVGGLVLWLATTWRTPVDPQKIIAPYLLTVIAFLVHVFEEYVAHIEQTFTRISGLTITQADFLTIAAFVAPIVWLVGAVMMIRRWPLGFFLASTFLFGMMFGEPTHLAFPFMEDGTFHYTAGMLTAILPVIGGWYTFMAMRREIRRARASAAGATP